mmetsp:Transcript_40167/g.72350  ORF Transcript_40167/g.72350 Transcript_40167/m.72350 type:complete len:204 (-) Transcript_40167:281-892(-)
MNAFHTATLFAISRVHRKFPKFKNRRRFLCVRMQAQNAFMSWTIHSRAILDRDATGSERTIFMSTNVSSEAHSEVGGVLSVLFTNIPPIFGQVHHLLQSHGSLLNHFIRPSVKVTRPSLLGNGRVHHFLKIRGHQTLFRQVAQPTHPRNGKVGTARWRNLSSILDHPVAPRDEFGSGLVGGILTRVEAIGIVGAHGNVPRRSP